MRNSDTFIADSLLEFEIPNHYYNGKFDKALEMCDDVEAEIIQKDLGGGYTHRLDQLRGEILHEAKRFNEVSHIYENLIDDNFRKRTIWLYRLAECYYHMKIYEEAKEILFKVNIANEPNFLNLGISFSYSFPRTYYLLGKVNEKLGLYDEAIKAYKQFLNIWKEADKNIPEYIDANKRLSSLKKS